jgi:hypothetical protein
MLKTADKLLFVEEKASTISYVYSDQPVTLLTSNQATELYPFKIRMLPFL